MTSKSDLAKLILTRTLANHDGAAIRSITIASFNFRTGLCYDLYVLAPSLAEQVEGDREIDLDLLHKILLEENQQVRLPEKEYDCSQTAITCFLIALIYIQHKKM